MISKDMRFATVGSCIQHIEINMPPSLREWDYGLTPLRIYRVSSVRYSFPLSGDEDLFVTVLNDNDISLEYPSFMFFYSDGERKRLAESRVAGICSRCSILYQESLTSTYRAPPLSCERCFVDLRYEADALRRVRFEHQRRDLERRENEIREREARRELLSIEPYSIGYDVAYGADHTGVFQAPRSRPTEPAREVPKKEITDPRPKEPGRRKLDI